MSLGVEGDSAGRVFLIAATKALCRTDFPSSFEGLRLRPREARPFSRAATNTELRLAEGGVCSRLAVPLAAGGASWASAASSLPGAVAWAGEP